MAFRRLVRGRVDWPQLEEVVRAIATHLGREEVHVRFLESDNWLSTPMVVDDDLFVKVVSRQNALVHGLFTTGRNLGAFSSGTEGFFEHFETPYEMARHELEATRRIRELGVNAPAPIEALEVDGFGVLLLEYLPEFRSLDELDSDGEPEVPVRLFRALRTLHDAGLGHGDLRAENVLILEEELYFIDATRVNPEARKAAKSYDLACALAALEPLVGARRAVDAALAVYSTEELLEALDFLDFVNIRPDHDCDAAALKGEAEKRAAGAKMRRTSAESESD